MSYYDPRASKNPYAGLSSEDSQEMPYENPHSPASAPAPALDPNAAGHTVVRQIDEIRYRPLTQAPVASPSQNHYQAPQLKRRPARPAEPYASNFDEVEEGPGRSQSSSAASACAAALLKLAAYALRLVAIAVAVLVVANGALGNAVRMSLLSATELAVSYIPEGLRGTFLVETPLGGVFRGDLAMLSCGLFILDWAFMRFAHSIRSAERRG